MSSLGTFLSNHGVNLNTQQQFDGRLLAQTSFQRGFLHCRTQCLASDSPLSRRSRSLPGKSQKPANILPAAALNAAEFRRVQEEKQHEADEDDEDDDELCPVECVREFNSNVELEEILSTAKQNNSLVVVDFYRTACGSCKYIEKGFIKLCKGAGDQQASVMFFKHNVMDEYEEQSEVAERLKIKVVPLFHFYKDGELVEAFPTREKTRILDAICKHTSGLIDCS